MCIRDRRMCRFLCIRSSIVFFFFGLSGLTFCLENAERKVSCASFKNKLEIGKYLKMANTLVFYVSSTAKNLHRLRYKEEI